LAAKKIDKICLTPSLGDSPFGEQIEMVIPTVLLGEAKITSGYKGATLVIAFSIEKGDFSISINVQAA